MANELVRFSMGLQDDLDTATKQPGQVLFALNDDKTGSIYFDKDSTNRYRMSWDLKDTTNKFTISAAAVSTNPNRVYPVALDKDGYLAVNVPWSNTTYTAAAPITLTGTQFSINDGAISNAKLAHDSMTIANKVIELGGEATSQEISSSPIIIGTQTAATAAWKGVAPFASLVDGQQITYWLPVAGTSTSATLELTLSDGTTTTGAIPCYYGGTTRLTTHYGAGTVIHFTYRENVTVGSTTIAAGWWGDANYVDGNTNDVAGYVRQMQNAAYMKPTTALYRYQILLPVGDGEHLIPANTTSNSTGTSKSTITTAEFNIFSPIEYYSTTTSIAAEGNIDGRYHWTMRSDVNLSYSFNTGTTLTVGKDVYLVCTLQSPITAKLRNPSATGANASAATGTGPITQTLPSTNDGYIYIKLGHAYSTSNIILTLDHPIYFHDGTQLQMYNTGRGIKSITRSGTTFTVTRDDGTTFTFNQKDDNQTYNAGAGLTLTGSTFAAKLQNGATKSSVTGNTISTTANRQYYVELDNSDKLSVNVPWSNTTYSASTNGITLESGNVFTLSLVSTTAASEAATSAGTSTGKYYPVGLDTNKKLVVNVPWNNTTYSAGTGLSLSGTQFSNTGIVTLAEGTSNGQTKVNGTDTTIVKGLNDLAYIAKDGTSSTKFLKGDGTWATPTDHTYNAGAGLSLSGSTFSAKLKNGATQSTVTANTISTTASHSYYVELDAADKLSVNVPWTNTTYSASNKGITLASGNVFTLSLVSDTAASEAATGAGSAAGKYYPVALDMNSKLVVNVPWSNTTYSAGTGLSLSGTQFSNTGIVTLAVGTNNGQTKVNGTDTTIVKGLNDLAYIAKDGTSSTKFLKGDGTWAVPTDHTYNAGAGLTLSGSTFAAKLKNGATKSSLTGNTISTTASRQYYVELDNSDYMSVNVPWTDTTYTASGNGISLSSQQFSLALKSTTKATYDSISITNTQNKQYAVVMDNSGYLSVNVPWSNTTYSAGTGLVLSSTQFSAKLRTTTALTNDSAAATETTNRIYSVVVDKSGYLSVVVPWTDTDTNTDTKVTQSADTQNVEYPIILKNSNTTTAETSTVKFNSTANKQTTVNPSTGTVSANIFRVATKVKLEYDSTTEALNFVFV